MADEEKSVVKTASNTVGALSLVGQVLSALEKIFTAFFFMAMEYARIKKKKAEDKAANLESQLKVRDSNDAIDEKNKDKSSEDILDDFMSSRSKPTQGGKPL
jgi:hypothetical protein